MTIRRLARGVNDFPKEHPLLGLLLLSAETIASALADRDRTRLQDAGVYADNCLGLSEQTPTKAVFLKDDPARTRTVKIGPTTIQLRRNTANNLAAAERLSDLLIQALRELDQEKVTPEHRAHLKRTLPVEKWQEPIKDLRLAPIGKYPIFHELAGETESGLDFWNYLPTNADCTYLTDADDVIDLPDPFRRNIKVYKAIASRLAFRCRLVQEISLTNTPFEDDNIFNTLVAPLR